MNDSRTDEVSQARRGPTAVCETVHMLALAVWLGALMTGAISAAIIFPAMRELRPSLGEFAAFEGEHWKLGAGRVQARIFFVGDFLQLGAGALAFLTLGVRLLGAGVARASRTAATAVRTLGVGAAVVLLLVNLVILAPRMNPHLKAYWELAAAGRTPEALVEADAFASLHPAATRTLAGTGAAVLVALLAGAWSLSRGPRP